MNARDGDGWTALHNASSKVSKFLRFFFKEINRFKFLQGYLDIVRWLCEQGGAAIEVDGLRGVDARSKGGWTPLSKLLIG